MLLAQDPAPDTTVVPVTDLGSARNTPFEGVSLPSVARAATLGVQVYPSVASADFAITGGLDDLHLTVTLAFTPSMENQRIKDEITTELIPGLEAILGASFARTTLDYSVAEPVLAAAPVAAA
ncbi:MULTISPECIES: hypothetical protein [Kocuria]|uniref:hypothetical protein n=1 Tax=Kocuria TaxID=57493 RepID=UPI000C87CC12|nr:hypothetical protein [Kocuria rhizophila]MCT1956631.1 hypothetical protein [Kocuria rhizophila]MCT2072525.1 hypothetical protein [Kocuria rhizophila]MDR7373421.1 hypothetical protein [Kocuria rhizophila]PMR91462.1 hypothetical protein C1H83_03360 [Kocuria rhizophila]